MKTYLVGYDLSKPGRNYAELFKALKAYPNWWHHLDSTWVIKTEWTTVQIRDDLWQHMDANDHLVVLRLTGEGAWIGINDEGSEWLKNHLSYS